MLLQTNHVAVTSSQWPMPGRFYLAVFGLKTFGKSRPINGITVSDSYCGLNINPRRDGYIGELDHFDMAVKDAERQL
jgi:hypothetical protein